MCLLGNEVPLSKHGFRIHLDYIKGSYHRAFVCSEEKSCRWTHEQSKIQFYGVIASYYHVLNKSNTTSVWSPRVLIYCTKFSLYDGKLTSAKIQNVT